MREALKFREGIRCQYTATFARWGEKSSYKGGPKATLLLRDIRSRGELVTDHCWVILGQEFARLGLRPGDTIAFEANSKPYLKGYRGRREDDDLPPIETDWKLAIPKHARVVTRAPPAPLPTFHCLATGCTVPADGFCSAHWSMLPKELKKQWYETKDPAPLVALIEHREGRGAPVHSEWDAGSEPKEQGRLF